MRQIIRLPLDAEILRQLAVKQQNITDGAKPKFRLSNPQRREITDKLFQAQRHLCCYCECRIDTDKHHAEHFFERSDFISKIYDYNNLLLSCQGENQPLSEEETNEEKTERIENIRCGHGKEESRHNNVPVDYNLLLNPTEDNTAIIGYNLLGELVSKSKVPIDVEKVAYTRNRLNLNSQRLIKQRRIVIKNTQKILKSLSEADQKTYITSLLDDAQVQFPAFHSTIKDNFGFILP